MSESMVEEKSISRGLLWSNTGLLVQSHELGLVLVKLVHVVVNFQILGLDKKVSWTFQNMVLCMAVPQIWILKL